MPRQLLGQHFLADLDWREQIARAIRVSRHSTVPLPADDQHCWIEIGAGHGEMTRHLLASGSPVTAIELDPSLACSDRKSTRLNSSHGYISYAVFCLKKKNDKHHPTPWWRQSIIRLARGAIS